METRATTSQEQTMEPAGATRLFAVWLWKEEFDAGSDEFFAHAGQNL
jgi:hypothetical protein